MKKKGGTIVTKRRVKARSASGTFSANKPLSEAAKGLPDDFSWLDPTWTEANTKTSPIESVTYKVAQAGQRLSSSDEQKDKGPQAQNYQDPNDKFYLLLQEVMELHNKKKADYAKKGDRFSNFKLAASFSGIEVFQSIENLIGIKQARLLELRDPKQSMRAVNNEPIRDSLIDRAVYSLLAVIWYDEDGK